jgi:dienelactone hydrolase
MKRYLAILGWLAILTASASGAITSRSVIYQDGTTTLEGQLVLDEAVTRARPGILLFHQWGGWGDYEMRRARQLAGLGYVVFVADVYGQGIRPATPEARGAEAGKYRSDRNLMRSRARAALETLKIQPVVLGKIAAIGFCFGGTVALELARSKAPLDAVVSIHGNLDTPQPADIASLNKLPVLILHGADDPYVLDDQLGAFRTEMRKALADWQINSYGGSRHAFTDPEAGTDQSKGAAYNPITSGRAIRDMAAFLREHLKPAAP